MNTATGQCAGSRTRPETPGAGISAGCPPSSTWIPDGSWGRSTAAIAAVSVLGSRPGWPMGNDQQVVARNRNPHHHKSHTRESRGREHHDQKHQPHRTRIPQSRQLSGTYHVDKRWPNDGLTFISANGIHHEPRRASKATLQNFCHSVHVKFKGRIGIIGPENA